MKGNETWMCVMQKLILKYAIRFCFMMPLKQVIILNRKAVGTESKQDTLAILCRGSDTVHHCRTFQRQPRWHFGLV